MFKTYIRASPWLEAAVHAYAEPVVLRAAVSEDLGAQADVRLRERRVHLGLLRGSRLLKKSNAFQQFTCGAIDARAGSVCLCGDQEAHEHRGEDAHGCHRPRKRKCQRQPILGRRFTGRRSSGSTKGRPRVHLPEQVFERMNSASSSACTRARFDSRAHSPQKRRLVRARLARACPPREACARVSWPSVFDLSVSGPPPTGSEGLGPPTQKTKTNAPWSRSRAAGCTWQAGGGWETDRNGTGYRYSTRRFSAARLRGALAAAAWFVGGAAAASRCRRR